MEELRRSHKGIIKGGVTKDNYSGLPEELKKFNYYYHDGETGHVLMVVPEVLLPEAMAKGDLDVFEVPVPCKYVLKNGYRMFDDHVIVQVKYNRDFGVMTPLEYFEV